MHIYIYIYIYLYIYIYAYVCMYMNIDRWKYPWTYVCSKRVLFKLFKWYTTIHIACHVRVHI